MIKLKNLLKESINEGKSLKDFKFVKPTLNFLMFLINKYGTKDHPYADESTINGFSVDYVTKLLKKVNHIYNLLNRRSIKWIKWK